MKKVTLLTINLVIMAAIFCCSKNPTQSTKHEELIPMKVGNYWIYKIYISDLYHNVINEYLDTLKVTGVSSDDKMFQITSSKQEVLPNGFYKNGSDGFYSENSLLFKYPAKVGQTCGGYEITAVGNSYYYTKNLEIIPGYSRTDLYYQIVPNLGIYSSYITLTKSIGEFYNLKVAVRIDCLINP